MSDWMYVGAHQVRTEGDLVVIRLAVTLNLAHAEEILTHLERVLHEYGQLYLLFDNTEAPKLDPAARRRFIEWTRSHKLSGVANFGGGVMQRTMALLLINAMRLLINRMPPYTYAATEVEARAWLDELRRLPRPEQAA